MRRILCRPLPQPSRPQALEAGEARHAVQVLRLRTGDLLLAMDGQGKACEAKIEVKGETVLLHHVRDVATTLSGNAPSPLHLEMAVLKGEAMEWVIEKAVELGVSVFQPVTTDHAVVQLDKKGPEFFQERWQKIADQAIKQCERLTRMEVRLPLSLRDLLSQDPAPHRYYCDETQKGRTETLNLLTLPLPEGDSLRILVGPEGGWSTQELKLLQASQVKALQLGELVLRAETAAILAAGCLSQRLSLTNPALQDESTRRP